MKRLTLVFECAAVLFLCVSGVGIAHLWKAGPLTSQVAGIAMLVPILSTLLFLTVSMAVPELFSVGALRFPLNITLPLVHTSLVFLTITLISKVGVSIMKMPDNMRTLAVWSDWRILLTSLVGGVLCLSVLAALGRERQER